MPTESAFHGKTCIRIGSKVHMKTIVLDNIFKVLAMRQVHFILSIQQYSDFPVDTISGRSRPHICQHHNWKGFGKSLFLHRFFCECLLSTYTYTYKASGARHIYHNWSTYWQSTQLVVRSLGLTCPIVSTWVMLRDKEDNNCMHSCGTQLDNGILYIDTIVMADQWDGMLKSRLTNLNRAAEKAINDKNSMMTL